MDDFMCPVCKSAPLITDYCPNCSRIEALSKPDYDLSPTPLQLECERLRAENAELRRDAERYRYGCSIQFNFQPVMNRVFHATENPHYEKEEFDTAIDEAMKGE